MPPTLAEAEKYTTNMVKKGVLKEIIRESPVLQEMEWIDVVGNAYQYLRESTLPTIQFYAPNEVWTESTGDVTQHTAVLRIMGGDADVDNFLKATRSNYTDLEAETIESKAKAAKHTFLDAFYYGDNAANPKQFDGVHKIIASITAQQIHEGSGTTGSALNATNLDAAFHKIRDGKPRLMMMTREVHQRMAQYLRSKGNLFTTDRDKWGNWMTMWNGVRVEYDDFLTQTETITGDAYSAKTGGATSSIFLLRFGSKDLLGLQNGSLTTKKLGQLESKDAVRWRIRWYCAIALMRTISIARIDGITNVAMAD
jgi:hypothetical protein